MSVAPPVSIEPLSVEEGAVHVRIVHPRLRRGAEALMLTDLGGRILDVAFPGRPSARARRLARRGPEAPWDALFWAENAAGPFYVLALSDGTATPTAPLGPPISLDDHVDRLNAPFLAPRARPACAPAEAIALGADPEVAAACCHQDVLRREADAWAREEAGRALASGRLSIDELILSLAAGEEMTARVFGREKAPALSGFRRRVAHRPRPAPTATPRAETVEAAFAALGLAFDPALWRSEPFEAALTEAEGDVAQFASRVDPLPLAKP